MHRDSDDIGELRPGAFVAVAGAVLTAALAHRLAPTWSLAADAILGLTVIGVTWHLGRSVRRERREVDDAHAELQNAIEHRAQVEREAAGLSGELIHARRFAAIGRLAGGVAHDFNNLLSAMTSNLVVALDDVPPGDAREGVEDALCAARRASELAKKLLALSRNEHVDLDVIDLAEEVGGMVRMLDTVAGPTVSLEVELPEGPIFVEGDPIQLEQVVLNLVVNARDAMPDGGRIVIELWCDAGGVHLRVRDQGEGMDETTRAHLFEPFYTTKEERGTGLGLSTCYDVVAHHRGSISVVDSSPRGTTFEVVLPVAREAVASDTVVLVASDDAVHREWTRRLRTAGFEVTLVPSAVEALAVLAERAPQLVCCAEETDAEAVRGVAAPIPVLCMNPPRRSPDASGVIARVPAGIAARVRALLAAA